jgi:hypothetical protein
VAKTGSGKTLAFLLPGFVKLRTTHGKSPGFFQHQKISQNYGKTMARWAVPTHVFFLLQRYSINTDIIIMMKGNRWTWTWSWEMFDGRNKQEIKYQDVDLGLQFIGMYKKAKVHNSNN